MPESLEHEERRRQEVAVSLVFSLALAVCVFYLASRKGGRLCLPLLLQANVSVRNVATAQS